MTKFLNISTDNTLGGNSPSDVAVSSQKAVREYIDAHATGSPSWGSITGTLSNQTDLKNALDAKYDASNPNGYTSNVGTVTSVNNVSPVNGNVTISIPSEVTETTVSGWGFTKNTGTVTSVNNVSPVNGNVTLSIPTVSDTYSATSSDAMSGKAVASAVSGYVPTSRTVNGKALSSNISLSANDVGALPDSTVIPTVNNATLTIQKNGTTVKTFTANASTDVTANITVPTKVSDLTNDSGFITGITSSDVTTALGYTPYNSTNPSGYQANVIETVKVNGTALTPSSKAVDITVPAAQVNSDWNASSGVAQILNKPSLATVATSGSYNDLSNKPTIPAAQVNSDWNASTGVAQILNKPSLATVATSGSYTDLSNKPTIPTVNNATLTLTQGGTTKGTFTANASSNVTIDLDSGGSVDVDNKSITTNSSDEIQTVGVINSRDSSTAIKTWTGTKAQYDAITTKDSATLYNITDDTTITQTILEALYPVGSVYITTANTCPLSTLISGSTWTLVSSGIVKAGDIPCKGTGMTLGLTNGTTNAGLTSIVDWNGADPGGNCLKPSEPDYGKNIGLTTSMPIYSRWGDNKLIGLTTDTTKSGIIADTSSLTLAVNIYERTA